MVVGSNMKIRGDRANEGGCGSAGQEPGSTNSNGDTNGDPWAVQAKECRVQNAGQEKDDGRWEVDRRTDGNDRREGGGWGGRGSTDAATTHGQGWGALYRSYSNVNVLATT